MSRRYTRRPGVFRGDAVAPLPADPAAVGTLAVGIAHAVGLPEAVTRELGRHADNPAEAPEELRELSKRLIGAYVQSVAEGVAEDLDAAVAAAGGLDADPELVAVPTPMLRLRLPRAVMARVYGGLLRAVDPATRARNAWEGFGWLAQTAEALARSAAAGALAEAPAEDIPPGPGDLFDRWTAADVERFRAFEALSDAERGSFVEAVRRHALAFAGRLDLSPWRRVKRWAGVELPTVDTPAGPVLWADAGLLAYIRRELVPAGDKGARADLARAEQASAERWRVWLRGDPQELMPGVERDPEIDATAAAVELLRLWTERTTAPLWLVMLAEWVWAVEVEPQIRRARLKPPAVLGAIFEPLRGVMAPAELDAGRGVVVPAGRGDRWGGLVLAHVAPAADLAAVAEGAELLRTLTAERLVRWMIRTAHDQHLRGEPRPTVIAVSGGWSGLASAIGAGSKKAADELRRLVPALRGLQIEWSPGGMNGRRTRTVLLSGYSEPGEKAAPGKARELLIEVPALLLPAVLKKDELPRDRSLIPVLSVPRLGAVNPVLHARAAGLEWDALAYVRRGVEELHRFGAVAVPWEELGAKRGLSPEAVGRLVEDWRRDAPELTGDDRYARWELTDAAAGRWMLADREPTRDARAFLLDGAARSAQGKALGLRRSASKAPGKWRR